MTSTLEDLVKDPERRIRLQERMEKRLEADFSACGLEVVRVSSAEFSGEEYENLESLLGDAEMARREAEYRAAVEKALRDIQSKDQKDAGKTAHDLREYNELLENEYRISTETRDREFALLKRKWEHDDEVYRRLTEVENLQHQHELESKKTDHELQSPRARLSP